VLLSVPFPGSVYAAFRIAQAIKAAHPAIVTVLGGGFVNTELRELREPRVFDHFDYVTLDDGERPLLALLEHLHGQARASSRLVRTFVRRGGPGALHPPRRSPTCPSPRSAPPPGTACPWTATCRCSTCSTPCTACGRTGAGTSSPWPTAATGRSAASATSAWTTSAATTAPGAVPAGRPHRGHRRRDRPDRLPLRRRGRARPRPCARWPRSCCGAICRSPGGATSASRSPSIPSSASLLADSGCIAVSGGLEVASDRLLQLMKKGVSVDQVARVTHAFSEAGVLVHAYLMYGFPTQTVQDTVDALEYVRQLFDAGCIQSGFFHRFACTVHSPVGKNPSEFGVRLLPLPEISFAKNDVGLHRPHRGGPRRGWASASTRRSTTTCTASAWTPMCAPGSTRRWSSPACPMSLKCGIVGLPNVGKSTLFNALTKAGIAAENYPFCTIEPNVGVVELPDPRLAQAGGDRQARARGAGDRRVCRHCRPGGGRQQGRRPGQPVPEPHPRDRRHRQRGALLRGRERHPRGRQGRPDRRHRGHPDRALPGRPGTVEKSLAALPASRPAGGDKDAAALVDVLEKCQAALDQALPVRSIDFSKEELVLLKPCA
jgi:hypothetical protein